MDSSPKDSSLPEDPTDLQARRLRYTKSVASCQESVPCALCPRILLPRDMKTHYLEEHDTNPDCLWCLKKFPASSLPSTDHLESCFQRVPRLSRRHLSLRKPPYLTHTHMLALPNVLTFQGNIQQAHHHVQTFLHCPQYRWFHVWVRAHSVLQFINRMDQQPSGDLYSSPFNCWCNGGTSSDPYERQHRHFILLSKGPCFEENLLPEMVDDTKPPGYRCIQYKPIETWLHLTRTIGYLARRESNCTFDTDREEPPFQNLDHFYIQTSLPASYHLCLATQVGDGALLDSLADHLRGETVNLEKRFLLRKEWHVRLQDIVPNLDEVLPVDTRWEPLPEGQVSNAYMYLVDGKRLYFQPNPELEKMPLRQWIWHQSLRGNSFYRNVADFAWKLSKPQQQFFDRVQDYQKQIASREEGASVPDPSEPNESEK